MTDASASGVTTDAPARNHTPATDGLAELRHILVGPEQSQLRELQAHIDRLVSPHGMAEIVSRILPEAVVRRPLPDAQLTQALTPTVEAALKISIQKDPQTLADAMFPIIGPAIRKAIAEALRGMLQSLNQALENSLSVQGLRWRLEAWRTGKPFAEVVLVHTLLYRVEQLFLIHRKTGLLLCHVVADPVSIRAPDVVSGMLTAIQDFVHDAFGGQSGETLEAFQVGELTVWIEHGPHAMLAAVLRGTPVQDIRTVLREALEVIHFRYGRALTTFSGEAQPFTASQTLLEACLVMQSTVVKRRFSPLLGILVALLLLGVGGWTFFTMRESQRWKMYIQRLNAEPGIVVTHTTRRHGKYMISGLRDPLAADPLLLLEAVQLSAQKVLGQWEPYQALHPAFILARATAALQPPETVRLHLDNSTLVATGTASPTWIANTRLLVRALPGITHYRDSALSDPDASLLELARALLMPPETVALRAANGVLSAAGTAPHAWIGTARTHVQTIPGLAQYQDNDLRDSDLHVLAASQARIEQVTLLFIDNETRLVPGQDEKVQGLVAGLQTLFAAAQAVGTHVRVEIIGHTDGRGAEPTNLALSRARAAYIATLLSENGLDTTYITAVGVGTKEPKRKEVTDEDRALHRRVSFRVRLTDEP